MSPMKTVRTATTAKPEKLEESKFVRKVRRHGYICIKLTVFGGYGQDGFNDQLVFASYGVVALFEFKRVGVDEAEKLQQYRHKILKRLQQKTYVVQQADKAYSILKAAVAEAKAAKEKDKVKTVPVRVDRIRR
jgi:hypothetical protein